MTHPPGRMPPGRPDDIKDGQPHNTRRRTADLEGPIASATGAKRAVVQRLILTFKGDEITFHTLYRSAEVAAPAPGTKARTRQVAELTRSGLRQALEALENNGVECVGTSGFTTREDVLLAASDERS